ncbi:MAG: CAP domain-containing protein [Sphingomonadales bacterium]|nr:MAG: CAP domain-containing protein [Sphingomonadales bacterium]
MPLMPMLLSIAMPVQPALEQQVLAEINFARTRPSAYAERLRVYRTYFKGRIVYYPGNPNGLRTTEGVKAVDEAIRFLDRQAPLEPIEASRLLARAAADHVTEQGPRGATGHLSANGANPRDRVQKRGGGNYVAEVITYGPPSATEVVRQFIVDDDVPGRGHRKTLFAAEMRFAGVACGPHRVYRTMCVAELGRKPDGQP